MPDLHKIRTTLRPEDEIEVGSTELLDLQRQGLVVDTKATTETGVRRAAARQIAEKEKETDQ